jgi:hypothetical protein
MASRRTRPLPAKLPSDPARRPSYLGRDRPELVETIPSPSLRGRHEAMLSMTGSSNHHLTTYTYGELTVICTKETGLAHLSVAGRGRYPTWDEIAAITHALIPGRPAVQVIPSMAEVEAGGYVNVHPHCLHVWEVGPGMLDRLTTPGPTKGGL